jgi:gamma-glutamylcyclotransferase (GGCT)/AIG2-like uncharacterized protein YtfP
VTFGAEWNRDLAEINRLRRSETRDTARLEESEAFFEQRFRPSCALAVYGTLAPGKANHHLLAGLSGSWSQGIVHGELHPVGWGMTRGFPALRWDPSGDPVPVWLFESADLPEHWARLDAFEGAEYLRVLVVVHRDDDVVVANLYAARAKV